MERLTIRNSDGTVSQPTSTTVEAVYGLTDFADDGSVAVFVKPSLEVADAVEVLAHELAHVAVGVEHDHDEVWQEAFDKIFEEYNRIGSQMFPDGEDSAMDDPDEK